MGCETICSPKAATRSSASSAGSFWATRLVAPYSFPTNRCSMRWKRSSKQSGYHVGTAIDMIVASRQFREIRGRDDEQEHE